MSEHVLKNTQATLSVNFSAGAADGNVAVAITDAEGTSVVSGNATHVSTSGTYTYVLPSQTQVKQLTVVWSGTWGGAAESIQHQVEVVGALLYTLAELRAFGKAELADAATWPDETLADVRARVTDLFEEVCDVSFVPRYRRCYLDGNGRYTLWLPTKHIRQVFAISVNGVAYTAPQLALVNVDRRGQLYQQGTWLEGITPNNIIVSYEYGWPFPPAEIARAALQLSHYELTGAQLADRMISITNEFGIVRQSIPMGYKQPTGLLSVDAVLCRYSEKLMEVGV